MADLTFTFSGTEDGALRRWLLRGPHGAVQFEAISAGGVRSASVYLHELVAPKGAELEDCPLCGKCWRNALLGIGARSLRAEWEAAGDDEIIREALERWYNEELSTPVPVSEGSQVPGEEVGPGGNGPNLAATGAGEVGVSGEPAPVAAPCPVWCDAKHLPTWPVHSAYMGEDIELGDDSALSLQVVDYGAGSGPVIALAVHTGGEDGDTLVIDLPLNQAFELRAVLEDAFDAIAADSVAVARAAAHRVDHNPETPGTDDYEDSLW